MKARAGYVLPDIQVYGNMSFMLTLNYTYRLYPDNSQVELLNEWLETCRVSYNYALRELKDYIASRKCPIDRCSLESEYIMTADYPFPSYHQQQNNLPKAKKQFPRLKSVPSQVLQTNVGRIDYRGTSQTCSNCRSEVRKELSDRYHVCYECGYGVDVAVDRDIVSAQEICNRGIETYLINARNKFGRQVLTYRGTPEKQEIGSQVKGLRAEVNSAL